MMTAKDRTANKIANIRFILDDVGTAMLSKVYTNELRDADAYKGANTF